MLKIVFFIHDSYMCYIYTLYFWLHIDTQSMNNGWIANILHVLQQIIKVHGD